MENQPLDSLQDYNWRIIACMPEGVLVCQTDGRIRVFNEAACRITGFPERDVLGKNAQSIPATFKPLATLLQRTLSENKNLHLENLVWEKPPADPKTLSVETAVLRSVDGSVLGATAVLKDITILKRLESRLSRSEQLAALGEMAAGVAHELRNPLNSIHGFSQQMAELTDNPTLKEYAGIVMEESHRMDSIIGDILDYGKSEPTPMRPADLHAIMEDVLTFLGARLDRAKVRVGRNFDPRLPQVKLAKNKVKQVMLNLVINALHAMEEGGGDLVLSTWVGEELLPAGQPDKEDFQYSPRPAVMVDFKDSGCGIPAENLKKLFRPFYTTKMTGTGLGLSVSSKIMEEHGGAITVKSEPGKGATFTLSFPLET